MRQWRQVTMPSDEEKDSTIEDMKEEEEEIQNFPVTAM
jgi:hypothetical protein